MASEPKWTSKYEYDFAKLSRRAKKWLAGELLYLTSRKTAQKQKYMFREVSVAREDRREMQELDHRISLRAQRKLDFSSRLCEISVAVL